MSALESLDARGLLCPLPVIRTQEQVRRLPVGATLSVEATDAGTLQDIPAWCRVHGHNLISSDTVENEFGGGLVYRFRIQVCGE
jgi:tRNA 2-thiouridine synthesizing protein A